MRKKREAGQISEKQQRILEFISEFITEHGYPPSVREIGQAMGPFLLKPVRGSARS